MTTCGSAGGRYGAGAEASKGPRRTLPTDPMTPFHIGLVAALCVAWLPGGLIHRGQQAMTPSANPALQVEACWLAGGRDCRQTAAVRP